MIPITRAVLLDARQDVASARAKVVRSGLAQVAVRRTEGIVVFWYAFDTQDVLARFKGHDDKASVRQALNLHEPNANPVQDAGAADAAPVNTNTVIVDGPRFIGVRLAGALPEPDSLDHADAQAAPPPPMAASVSGPGSLGRMVRKLRSLWTGRAPASTGEPWGDTLAGTPAASQIATVFTAYPRLDTPATVSPRQQFKLTVGLASRPDAGTAGGPFSIGLAASVARFSLDVLVVADGFDMPAGGRHRLDVDRADPYAKTIDVVLVAPDSGNEVLLTTISVIYFFDNLPCGTAARRIAVVPAGTQAFSATHGNGQLWTRAGAPGGAVTVRPGIAAVDLTVTISKPDGNPATGRYVWTFQSPHAVALPALPVTRDLGMEAHELGTKIIEGIQNSEAQGMVEFEIGGLGKNIADRMPLEFWPLLRAVAQRVEVQRPGQPPCLLFLTAEAHVPWELALLDQPLDAKAPPYLGCQTDMARWPLSDSGHPPLPPADNIDVHQFAVVVGDYAARSGWRKLQQAEQEGDTISSRYGAIKLIAEPHEIKQLLSAQLPTTAGSTGAQAVHFACHGEATPGHVLDAAIILGQGQRMSPTWLANAPLGKQHRPFLFLNACQVGKAGELLGSFSGFAGESLKGGFRGFLAPIWSVDDALAHDIALEFYERVFGAAGKPPQPVASVLRDLRRRFAPDTEKSSASRLAYVFYGHPGLILRKGN